MTGNILNASRLFGNIELQLKIKAEDDKNQKDYLSFLTAQRMIKRFLTCDRIITTEVRCRNFTSQELAEKLSVNLSELEVFIRPSSKAFYRKTAGEIALPLIRLYCNTKWAGTE